MTTLIIFGAVNFTLFGLFSLFRFNKPNKYHLYFAITLLSIASVLIRVAYFRGWSNLHWISYLPIFSLAIAPAFYLYILEITSQTTKNKFFHFIPSIVHVLYQLSLKLAINYSIIEKSHTTLNSVGVIIGIFLVGQLVYYIVRIKLVIDTNSNNIQQHYSNLDGKQLKWVKTLFICLVVLIGIWIVTQLINWFFDVPVKSMPLVFCSLWVISYYLFGISLIQKKIELTIEQQNTSTEKTENYSPLWKALNSAMKEHQYFLDEGLSLQKLSKLIDTPQRILSQCINHHGNMNFHAFINSFRINQVKKEMADKKNSHLTILGIAYKAGFKSKSSFNQVFKDSTGFTPKEYIKKQE